MFRHDMQLLDRKDFPQFGQNLDRKTTLRRGKNTPVAPIREAVSPGPKLDLSQVWNFKEDGILGFPRTLRTSKTDIGSYVNRARKNWRK